STGKTFKGKEGGVLKVLGIDQNGPTITLKVEFDAPGGVVPAGQGGLGGPFLPAWNGPIQLLPVPVPAPAPQPLPRLKRAFQVQAAPAQVQVAQVAQVQIQIQIGGFGGPGFPVQGGGHGLELLDEKGNVIANTG